jgi:HSP20 family protein
VGKIFPKILDKRRLRFYIKKWLINLERRKKAMKITRWHPMEELSLINRRLRKLLDEEVFPEFFTSELRTWAPPVDIYETENEIVVKAELPEVDIKDVELKLENNRLTIKGERKFSEETKKENYHLTERYYGSFKRTFELPGSVDPDKVEAKYEKGVLIATLPKREETKKKKIEIKTGD